MIKLERVAWDNVPDDIKTFMVMTVPSMATLPLREEVANALMQLTANAYTAGYSAAKKERIPEERDRGFLVYMVNYDWKIVCIDLNIFPPILGPGNKAIAFDTEEQARKYVKENKPK